ELDGRRIDTMLQDRDGAIWTRAYLLHWKLCAVKDNHTRCYDDDGPGVDVGGLYEDKKGNLWAGTVDGLWRWKPGVPQFFGLTVDNAHRLFRFSEDDDGALLILVQGGLARFLDGRIESVHPLPRAMSGVAGVTVLRDRDGGLWIGTRKDGLVHVHDGRADAFTRADGLSGDFILDLFEDREGSIWVVTSAGIDRFRVLALTTLSVRTGLPALAQSLLSTANGGVWLGTEAGLYRWKNGNLIIPRTDKLPGKPIGQFPLFEDDRGRIWISTIREVGYLIDERYVAVAGLPQDPALSIAEDLQGDMWFVYERDGLVRLSRSGTVTVIPWSTFGQKIAISTLADRRQGGLWLGFYGSGGISYFVDGQVRASYTSADGLPSAQVNDLRLEPDGTMWAATDMGLSRLKNGHAATLTVKNGLPCDNVHAVLEDDDRSFWLLTSCGVVRILSTDLDVWGAAVDGVRHDSTRAIQTTYFDGTDGAAGLPNAGGLRPIAAKASGGTLWFRGADGVNYVDPRHGA